MGQETGAEGTEERGGFGRNGGQGFVGKLQAERVGHGANAAGNGGHFSGAVKHNGESVDPEEAEDHAQQEFGGNAETLRLEFIGLEADDHGHEPSGKGGHNNNHEGVAEALQAGTHIHFCHVDAAGDEGKPGNDKQHGADVTGFMSAGGREPDHEQPENADVSQARCGNTAHDAGNKRYMTVQQQAPDKIAQERAEERTEHFPDAAAE